MMVVVATCFVFKVSAQTEAEKNAWMTYMMPGDMHKMLEAQNGEWDAEVSMWMQPGAPPTKSTAMAKNEMVMGGRYQMSKTIGTMMGMPFEGMSLLGYDNMKKIKKRQKYLVHKSYKNEFFELQTRVFNQYCSIIIFY